MLLESASSPRSAEQRGVVPWVRPPALGVLVRFLFVVLLVLRPGRLDAQDGVFVQRVQGF